ncbi:MAG: type II secretion system protein GspL [Cocleimonas sp.]
MQLLIIKLNSLQAIPEYALLGKKQAEDRFTPSNWKKVTSLTRGRKVLLLIPNSEVVLSELKIPSKNKKQLLRAVPFALEDSLAEDLEDLHFAIHQRSSSQDTQVAVINHDRLGLYTALLRQHKITPYYVLPQLLAQAYEKDSWSVMQNFAPQINEPESSINTDKNDIDVSVRTGKYTGFSSSQSLLNLFLIEQFEQQPPKKIFTNIQQSLLPDELQECEFNALDSGVIKYKSAIEGLDLNLLTGYVQQGNTSRKTNWKAWKPALIIAGLLATTWGAILGYQNTQLQQQHKQLDTAINRVFLDTFPNSRVVDAPQQMKSKLTALQKQTGKTISSPIPLIADIAPLLKKYNDINMNELRYQEGELVLMLKVPNLTRLESFKKEAKNDAGLNVKIKDSNTTADKVEAQVIISPLSALKPDFIKQDNIEAKA